MPAVRARTHVCQVAGCVFAAINAKDLQAHNRKQHGAELLSCSKCTKKYTDQSNLSRHQRLCDQVGDELWYCPYCHNSRGTRRDNVKRHIDACPQRGGREVFVPPKAAAAEIDRLAAAAALQNAAPFVAAPAQVHDFGFASPVAQVAQPATVPAADAWWTHPPAPSQQPKSFVGFLPEGTWGDFWTYRATSTLEAGKPGPALGTNPAFDVRVVAMLEDCRVAADKIWALSLRYDQWVAEVDARMRPVVGELEDDEAVVVRRAALYEFYNFERHVGNL